MSLYGSFRDVESGGNAAVGMPRPEERENLFLTPGERPDSGKFGLPAHRSRAAVAVHESPP